jgi:hypothetical protein
MITRKYGSQNVHVLSLNSFLSNAEYLEFSEKLCKNGFATLIPSKEFLFILLCKLTASDDLNALD